MFKTITSGAFASALVLSSPFAAAQTLSFADASPLIDFVHESSDFGGGGLAGACWFDYDNDGRIDLFLTNGPMHDNSLFRNQVDGTFLDVASAAGVTGGLGYSGVVAADIDNDGFQDLFLTGDGGITAGGSSTGVTLFRNNGNGTFNDITASSGIVPAETVLSAAFGDVDNDGFLDLFITAPGSLSTQVQHANQLFRNNGNLTFTDISASSGVDTSLGACAVFFSDYDNDGFIDIFVADCNDVFFAQTPIELFRNNGDLTFTDVAGPAGLTPGGFWMGFGPADHDNDGDIDFFVTNIGGGNTRPALYENNGDGTYTNVTLPAGTSVLAFGWGVSSRDYDNDGFSDIFFAGGLPGFLNSSSRLFRNDGDGTYSLQILPSAQTGLYRSGVAAGDFDNDGFEDIVVAVDRLNGQGGTPILLHNTSSTNNWVKLKLQGTVSNRDAVGARIRVTAGEMTQTKEIYAGSSFASMDSQWQIFGLGTLAATDLVKVEWPSGLVERFADIPAGQTVTLVEGQGCLGPTNFCSSTPNSSGSAATISAGGTCFVSEDDFVLRAGPVPDNVFGIFFYSTEQLNAGNGLPFGNGTRCVGGGPTYRLAPQISAAGALTQALDFGNPPVPAGAITAGSTWNFQALFRDTAAGGAAFDLSDGLAVSFLP